MPLFQVQLKQGSLVKTYNLEAKSVTHIIDFFDYLTTMKVTEVRKVEYIAPDTVIPVDDPSAYLSMCKLFVKNDESNMSKQVIIPHVKLTRDENEIFAKAVECLEIDNLSIDSIFCPLFKQ